MKKITKKALAVILAIVMLSGTLVCFAAELNQEAVNLHYGQYENYLLLGDSVASGYRDEVSDNDEAFNVANNHTTYYRVPGSYADIVANAIVADKSMTALAAPGFRTIELRYMLNDEYAKSLTPPEEDSYLFHPSQLYVYDEETCSCHGEILNPYAEHFREQFKDATAKADLITLGIGGNDWGAYISWLVADLLEEENVADEYIQDAKEVLEKSTMDLSTVSQLVEIAHIAGALPKLLEIVPTALNEALKTFYTNWNLMIQDIYNINPDATLIVLGMSDNSLKGKYFDYNGVTGEAIPNETDPTKAQATAAIVGAIMTVANKPMIDGADKFGYTYVDTSGTTYVDSHPDAGGHEFIANKIIEALPNPDVFNKYTDVKPGQKYYNDVEYVVANGIMTGISDTEFGADSAITVGQLAAALNKITGAQNATDDTNEVTVATFAFTLFGGGFNKGFAGFFKTLALSLSVISDSNFKLSADVSRGLAAKYLATFCEI